MTTSDTYTDITCIGSAIVPEADVMFSNLACGPRIFGEIHCPSGTVASGPGDGDYLVLAVVLADAPPGADPTWLMQYGFVFETDNDPTNDWAPIPAFPLDFFGGADLWIELLYDPATGWSVNISDIGPGNTVTPRASSAAKVAVVGNILMAAIPVAEAGLPADLDFRGSAFKHQGSFLMGPWNGDAWPPPPMPLEPVP